jgi:hypothetical protein
MGRLLTDPTWVARCAKINRQRDIDCATCVSRECDELNAKIVALGGEADWRV